MAVTGANREEDFLLVDMKPEETLATFKDRVEFQTGIPPTQQTVNFNGQNLVDVSKTLQQCQITAVSTYQRSFVSLGPIGKMRSMFEGNPVFSLATTRL